MSKSDNNRIAKNTIVLYFRMMLIMFVSLYTSRITLQVLGVDDYGIYQTVAGVVTFLAFVSNALSAGTSRFITFEMGKEEPKLGELFATVRLAHIVLAALIVIAGEIIGLWMISNKLVIPQNRIDAAVFAFHMSMVTTFFQITQVPYNALIVSHEKMDIYAFVSIGEAILKMLIVFMLKVIFFDKLKVYSVLFALSTIVIMMAYRIYCKKHFAEVGAKLIFNKNMFSQVASFSSWNMISSLAASFANQGVTVVTNMFFSPAVVTIRSLALRINTIINQFIGSFRTAVNPQIIKKYAAGDYEESKKLALDSTKYSYYLMLLIVLPLFLLAEPALKIWLGDIPIGLIPFVQISLVRGLFQAFDTSLYVPIYAKGQIKENAIISPIFDFIQLPIVYILFKYGFPAITLAWVELFACVALGVIAKPVLVKYVAGYNIWEIYKMIGNCFATTVLAAVLPVYVAAKVNANTFLGFIIIGSVSVLSIAIFVWFVGLNRQMREMLIGMINTKLKNIKLK